MGAWASAGPQRRSAGAAGPNTGRRSWAYARAAEERTKQVGRAERERREFSFLPFLFSFHISKPNSNTNQI